MSIDAELVQTAHLTKRLFERLPPMPEDVATLHGDARPTHGIEHLLQASHIVGLVPSTQR